MAFSVTAVSISVSPFRIDDDDTDMFITSAPSRLPANSNDACVRVEASKNMLISVRPRSEAVFFSIWRLSSTNSPARSSRPTMSSRESPSIPSKWRLLRTNEDLWAMFIKAPSYRRGGGLRQADRIAVHRHEWAGGGCDFSPGRTAVIAPHFLAVHAFVFGIPSPVARENQEHRMRRSVVEMNPALIARGRAELRKRR